MAFSRAALNFFFPKQFQNFKFYNEIYIVNTSYIMYVSKIAVHVMDRGISALKDIICTVEMLEISLHALYHHSATSVTERELLVRQGIDP